MTDPTDIPEANGPEAPFEAPEPNEAAPPRPIHPAFRLAAFLVLLIAGAAAIGFGWRALGLPRQMHEGVVRPLPLLATGALLVLLGVGVTWLLLRRFEGRGLRTVGLGLAPGLFRRAAIGFFFGGLTPAIVATSLAIAGIATIAPAAPASQDLLGLTLPMIGAMIFISSWEEILLRGYFMQVIGEMGGPWIAAGISGVLFGLMHAGNPGANPAGLIITAANGVLLAMLAVRTGSLWLACWYHAGWNLVAAIGFGLKDSGMLSPGALFSTDLNGPTLLTGGSYGFEASIVSYVVEAVILVLLLIYAPRWAGDAEGWPYYQGKR
ncbi:MAG TPA: type II CAAX endopeptidase family protein [Candidatus Eisenbacteria bacterium]